MKKFLSLLLCFTLLLSLAACGGETAPETQAPTAAPTEAPTEVPTEAPTEEPTLAPTEPMELETEELVLVDDENLTFIIKGFSDNAHLGLEMQVYCENKTDRPMMFSLDGVSVCGIMYDPFWAMEVTAGKKANDTIYFDTFALAEMGIESPDEISFRLYATDFEDWMANPYVNEPFTVYPTGKTAETVVYPEYQHKNGETVLLDTEELLFIVEKVSDTDSDLYTLECYIVNRTDRDLIVSWDGVSVNGFMIDPLWAAGVLAGKQLYVDVSFLMEDLREQDIETVTEIELTFWAGDEFGETVVEEEILFQPK